MSQQAPLGRRRAAPQRTEPDDRPASHATMARVWRTVSRVQGVLSHRLLHFENTRTDDRLADQLYLLATLHDWRPVSESEAADLIYLLDLYLSPAGDATRGEVARILAVTIRGMAAFRATQR